MDMNISGISFEIIEKSLEQAKAGRLHILEKMIAVISEHSNDVKDHAPWKKYQPSANKENIWLVIIEKPEEVDK